MLQVYTGDGKGKTTAALGAAVRAAASGGRVAIVYFDKGGTHYSERRFLEAIKGESFLSAVYGSYKPPKPTGRVDYVATGLDRIDPKTGRFRFGVTPADKKEARRGLVAARKFLMSGKYSLVILDELNTTTALGMLPLRSAIALLRARPKDVELIVTGRRAPEEILAEADLITEMKLVKHYFYKGIRAREGIDY
jgi:cob(I)alamin adenosyltransferase